MESTPTIPGPQIVEATKPVPSSEERTWALFAHLGTLVLWVIAPIVALLTKGKESAFVRQQALESLNFQITLVIAFCIATALAFVGIGLFLYPVISVAGLVLILLASLRSYQGVAFRYPLTIRLFR
jgi:uncharacterized Tic20 family protein